MRSLLLISPTHCCTQFLAAFLPTIRTVMGVYETEVTNSADETELTVIILTCESQPLLVFPLFFSFGVSLACLRFRMLAGCCRLLLFFLLFVA